MYVHTPLITGSDCEGAGEMFRVTTMDLANVPKNADGTVDYSKDFFGKETKSDRQRTAQRRDLCTGFPQHLYVWSYIPRREFQYYPPCG